MRGAGVVPAVDKDLLLEPLALLGLPELVPAQQYVEMCSVVVKYWVKF